MRWIFLALVFVNLLLLAYFWQQQGQVVTQPAVAIDLPVGGKKIQLLKELPEPLSVREASQAIKERSALCYTAGPYEQDFRAKDLLERAAAQGFNGKVKTVEVAKGEPNEYWVYVPSRASREEALRTLRELQQRKFDSYIITQGEHAEGISLGLFRNADLAYRLQKAIEAVNIPAQVQVMNKITLEYWVEVSETSQLNEAMRERIKANDQDIRWELLECQ